MFLISRLKKIDWVLLSSVILLTAIGLVSLYSSSLARNDFSVFHKQIIFSFIGLFFMLGFSFFNYRIFKNNSYLILFLYFFSCLGLLGLFFLAPEIRGVKSWYKIGSLSFDPIEPLKIVLIILLAKYFSARHIEMYKIKHILISFVYVLIPCVLIFFQPDLGSVLILLAVWFAILIISEIKLKHFLILCFCGILVFSLSWTFLMESYQQQRILNFIAPQMDPLGMGWSQTQSKIAIGSGGLLGKGIGEGSQTQYGFLSEPRTDFIFAAIGEEMGLLGCSAVLILFLILIARIFKIFLASSNNFSRLFAFGLAGLFISQIFVNIGMNLGFLPIIGISLPFVSYGGSNLIMSFIALGILMNIKSQ
ncbi:MAG: rod shape-determining protein RodA [Patescibacteria group bacterium]|nr:rod shape-determining protein RodA [Patescibacteria group bacterium]